MIKINKQAEPNKWVEYRNTPGVDYQSIPELVESLLEEQGYICAYCMRRIPVKDRLCEDKKTDEDHRVEHVLSRDNHDDLKLTYKNMVICCPGHIGSEDHCDRLKGERDVTFNLFDQNFIDTLSYKTDGEIVSSNVQYNKEINEVLNLNTPLLKTNRISAWNSVKNLISNQKNKPWTKSELSKYIEKYSSVHNNGGKKQYIPYCGVVLYFLYKKMRQLP